MEREGPGLKSDLKTPAQAGATSPRRLHKDSVPHPDHRPTDDRPWATLVLGQGAQGEGDPWPARGQGDYRVIELLANPDQLGRPSSPRDPANPEWPGRTSVGRWPTTPDSEKNALVMGNRGLTESQVKRWHSNRDMAQDPIAAPRATRETPVSQRGLPEDWSSHRVIELLANPDQPGHEQPAATPSGGLFKAPTRMSERKRSPGE
ncbi:MAG: hypothetical protein M1815_000391 [Lichina confinis]|nr:MAG: hypothetical protein M1815_000391 [Lichina confinis]